MVVFVVVTNYYDDGFLGVFSSLAKAREGIRLMFEEDDNIAEWENCGDYAYLFTTKNGEGYHLTIVSDIMDSAIV